MAAPWGVLIVASGNIVHRLRTLQANAADDQAYDWALAFDQTITDYLQKGNMRALQDFGTFATVRQAHPGHDPMLPLRYAAGAAQADEEPQFLNTRCDLSSGEKCDPC